MAEGGYFGGKIRRLTCLWNISVGMSKLALGYTNLELCSMVWIGKINTGELRMYVTYHKCTIFKLYLNDWPSNLLFRMVKLKIIIFPRIKPAL